MVSTTPNCHIQGVGLWWRWDHWLGAQCNRILKITGEVLLHVNQITECTPEGLTIKQFREKNQL